MINPSCYFGLLLAALTVACSQSSNTGKAADKSPLPEEQIEVYDETKYLIAIDQVGPFKIGNELPGPTTMMKYQMRVEQKKRNTDEGPVTESVTIIAENGTDLLWLKPGLITNAPSSGNTIQEILIVSPRYKTTEEIGMGSTLSEFISAYPEYRIWYTYVSGMYVIETPSLQVQFLIDKNAYTGGDLEITSEQTDLTIEDFNMDAKIKSVRLTNYAHNL